MSAKTGSSPLLVPAYDKWMDAWHFSWLGLKAGDFELSVSFRIFVNSLDPHCNLSLGFLCFWSPCSHLHFWRPNNEHHTGVKYDSFSPFEFLFSDSSCVVQYCKDPGLWPCPGMNPTGPIIFFLLCHHEFDIHGKCFYKYSINSRFFFFFFDKTCMSFPGWIVLPLVI